MHKNTLATRKTDNKNWRSFGYKEAFYNDLCDKNVEIRIESIQI